MDAKVLTITASISVIPLISIFLFAFLYGGISWILVGIAGFIWSLLAWRAIYSVNLEIEKKMKEYEA